MGRYHIGSIIQVNYFLYYNLLYLQINLKLIYFNLFSFIYHFMEGYFHKKKKNRIEVACVTEQNITLNMVKTLDGT